MNNIDRQYKELLEHIIRFGVNKSDRTGTGTKSIFGWQIRHNMKEGFPLLTTKKMAWKSIVTELLWFLRGDTNIKYLVDNDCHIWDGDAYKVHLHNAPVGHEKYLTKEEFINKIKTDLEFAKTWGELGPIYGKQWRNWHYRSEPFLPGEEDMVYTTDGKPVTWSKEKDIDQIQNLINELKINPDSRRLMVSAWNVGELDQMVLPPCHYGFQVYTRELSDEEKKKMHGSLFEEWETARNNFQSYAMKVTYGELNDIQYNTEQANHWDSIHKKLSEQIKQLPTRAISLMWNQRSVDTFLGLPFNIASYALLLEIIAKEVDMVPEELIGNLGDVHLYSNHIEQAKEQIVRIPYELPKLLCKDEYWYLNDINIPFVEKINKFKLDFFILENYQSHPPIKAPLSN